MADSRLFPDRLETRDDLRDWVRAQLRLSSVLEQALFTAFDDVLSHQERLGRESKEEALRALVAGSMQRLDRVRDDVKSREATVSKITEYFEHLVDDLTRQTHRDSKTNLLNLRAFMDRVELSLRLGQTERWCALGLIDIASFKRLNDTLGHPAGDAVIQRVAQLLRREVRESDLVSYERRDHIDSPELHGRFGGDEFCFFLPSLASPSVAAAVAERFWQAVHQHDWPSDVSGLAVGAVDVDVGVVCFSFGSGDQRRENARFISEALLIHADTCMYEAKHEPSRHFALARVRLQGDALVACSDGGVAA
jgi:diguanylate cyclase (GGDEF)-like protein